MNINNTTIFYITNDFERSLGLEKILPNFHIICIDNNSSILELRNRGVNIFCLEEELGESNPIFRNSNKLLNHPEVIEYIKKNTKDIKNTYLMFFKIAPNTEITAKKLGYKIVNSSAKLNQIFEHKISQYEQLSSLNYFPQTRIIQLKDIKYNSINKELGTPFVIQYDRGHTGSGTVFINSEEELISEQKLYPERICKVSRYINGDAWTINACSTRFGTVYGGLSYQITGLPECTSKKGATVGNDWTHEIDYDVLEQIKIMTEEIGEKMYKQGFKGMFGLDIVIENGLAYLIEVNARQTASVSMHTKLMLKDNHIPLEILHILEYISKNDNEYLENINTILNTKYTQEELSTVLKEQNDIAIQPIQASQIIIRNSTNSEIKINKENKTGIYKYENNNLKYIREGYSIDDILNKDEYCIIFQEKNRIVSEEYEIARIQSLSPLLSHTNINEILKKIKEKVI